MISPGEARRRAEQWARTLLADELSAQALYDTYGNLDVAVDMLAAAELNASWIEDVLTQYRPLPAHPGTCDAEASRPAPPQCPRSRP